MESSSKLLCFAPMEGITDSIYRQTILSLYPEWNRLFTAFLRMPIAGTIRKKTLIHHLGKTIWQNENWRQKNVLQLMVSERSNLIDSIKMLTNEGISEINLNAGCPVPRVMAHGAGSYLLSQPQLLKKICREIRQNFRGIFSVKLRLGIKDDHPFIDNLKIVESEGADYLIIHPRTQKQMYQGKSDWHYWKKASEQLSIPIVANGDIDSVAQLNQIFSTYHLKGAMIGRAALSAPYLARLFKGQSSFTIQEEREQLAKYFHLLEENYLSNGWRKEMLLQRLKCISNYLLKKMEELPEKRLLLRSKNLVEFKKHFETSLNSIYGQ